MALSDDPVNRKETPICTGVLDYFPDALAEVARVSLAGNKQHNLGPLRWDKSKSTDEADALMRHLIQRGTLDTDGMRHTAKVAWRALALLQREIERDRDAASDSKDCGYEGGKPKSLAGTGNLANQFKRIEGLATPPYRGRTFWFPFNHPPSGFRLSDFHEREGEGL